MEMEEVVEKKEYAPRFNPGLEDRTVNLGQSVHLSCTVDAIPKASAKKEGEEPFFTKGLVDIWTDRGDSFTLKCAVKGDPFPEIKW
ncbi:hypothetical protein COOONC_28405 [Cooperia oncophora]